MGGCVSSPPPSGVSYEVSSSASSASAAAAAAGSPNSVKGNEGNHHRRSSWSDNQKNDKEKTKEKDKASKKKSDRKKEKHDRDRDRESSRSRSRSKKGSKHGASSTRNVTSSHNRSQSSDGTASWQDGAAALISHSASELQAEERELDDWQRGMLDILEEQSIQAYDMDMSVGPGMERRYSNSLIGQPSVLNNSFEVTRKQTTPTTQSACRSVICFCVLTSAFLFVFPIVQSPIIAPRNMIRSSHRLVQVNVNVPEANPTILVVDEHPSTRQIITKWMTSSKYTEISCASGAQAMEILVPTIRGATHHHVDVIICDVSVLVHDGSLLLDWVINTPGISEIPVIVLSSNLPSQGLERLIRRGAWDVLHKPLNRAVFLNALATVFNTRRQKSFIDRLRAKGDEYKEKFFKFKHVRNPAAPRPSLTSAQSLSTPAAAAAALMPNSPYNGTSIPSSPYPSWGTTTPPNHHSPTQGHRSSPTPHQHIQHQATMQPIQVLLVESNPAVADQLTSWIASESVAVRCVRSVGEALPILRDSQRLAAMAASSNNVSPQMSNHSLIMPNAISRPNSVTSTDAQQQPPPQAQAPTATPQAQPQRVLGLGHHPSPPLSGGTGNSPNSTHGRSLPSGSSFRHQAVLSNLTSPSFGVELILIDHDALIPPECMNQELAALGVEDPEDEVDDSNDEDEEHDYDTGNANHRTRRSTTFSPITSLATAQQLIDLTLQPVWGKARRLPVVVVCEEDGPSPVAMAILKHVALTVINAPMTKGLVNKKMGLIIGLIEQNRQSLLLARRAHIYKGLLTNLVGSGGGASLGAGVGFDDDDLPGAPSPGGPRRSSRILSVERTNLSSPKRAGGASSPGFHGSAPSSPALGPESGSLMPRNRSILNFEPGSARQSHPPPIPGSEPEPMSAPMMLSPSPSPVLLMPERERSVSISSRQIVHSSRARNDDTPGSGILAHTASKRVVLRIRTDDAEQHA